jgi:hypothetical protein
VDNGVGGALSASLVEDCSISAHKTRATRSTRKNLGFRALAENRIRNSQPGRVLSSLPWITGGRTQGWRFLCTTGGFGGV